MPINLHALPVWWANIVRVPAASMTAEAKTLYRTVHVSFETGEQATHRVYFEQAVTIVGWRAQVTKALAATDAGTITLQNSAAANITPNAVLSLAASTAINAVANQGTPTANTTVAAGDYVQLVVAKTTAGGKAQVTIAYQPS